MTPTRRRLLGGAGALCALALGGCAWLMPRRPNRIPMDLLKPEGPCRGRAPALVVMLPGAYSLPAEFVDEGFTAALRRSGAGVDVVIADAHLGYFGDGSVLRRLREDVVLPARAAGYRQVWLVGISLGGYAALAYAMRHGDEVDGIVALAPYLGPRRLQQEIAAAGGPRAWRASAAPADPAAPASEDGLDRGLWAWLAGPPPPLPIYLGYGVDDRFADAHRVLAGLLPAERVDTAPGGHDWPAWRVLWQSWLARGLLPTGCAAPA